LSFPIEIFFTPSSTKVRRDSFYYKKFNKERKEVTLLLISSSPPAASTMVMKPFTRSSAPKEVVEEQSLPKASILQKKKGKGIVKPVEKKEETPVQKKKDKDKGIKKPHEIDKAIPMQ
jgi:hypothetical protein